MVVQALIADGSARVREVIRDYLEWLGCRIVAEAGTAAQALPLVRTVRPELVALGSALPPDDLITPIELVRLIKRELPNTSVVMLAGEGPGREMTAFLGEGILGYVAEPLDSAAFKRLERMLSAAFPELGMRRAALYARRRARAG